MDSEYWKRQKKRTTADDHVDRQQGRGVTRIALNRVSYHSSHPLTPSSLYLLCSSSQLLLPDFRMMPRFLSGVPSHADSVLQDVSTPNSVDENADIALGHEMDEQTTYKPGRIGCCLPSDYY